MKHFWLLNLLCGAVLSIALPQGAWGKHTVLDLGGDSVCSYPVMQEISFSSEHTRYKFIGICDLVQTRLKLAVKVPYTAVGTYDPKTGETHEGIEVPPPAINQPSRPYGRFKSAMHCNMDPWLNTRRFNQPPYVDENVRCDQRSTSADPPWTAYGPGPVGDYMKILIAEFSKESLTARPYTVWMDEDQRKSLNAQYQTLLAAEKKADQILQGAKQPSSPYSALIQPLVLNPKAGQILPPQRPVTIKLAPPKNWRVNTYTVIIQRKESNGNWVNHTTIPISAIVAHSPTGYTGFGGGAPPAFLMLPGKWRLSAHVSSPKQSGSSDWVEFSAFESADFAAPKRRTPSPF